MKVRAGFVIVLSAVAAPFRLTRATLLMLVLGLAACGGDPGTEMTDFRGTYSGTTSIAPPGEERSLERCNANASDGPSQGFMFSGFDELTGEFNVLGPVTIVASDCIDPERGEFAQGRAIVTNADGDGIMTEFQGSVQPANDAAIEAGRTEHKVVGGTGRFVGAEGMIVCEFRVRVSTSEITGTCQGQISV